MITHYKPVDFEMEKEIAELEACLQQHKTVGIIHKKIYGKSYRWRSQKKMYILSEAEIFYLRTFCKRDCRMLSGRISPTII